MSTREGYHAALKTALDCIHGQPGGDLVRPWTGTPGCALCRRRDPVTWRHGTITADINRALL